MQIVITGCGWVTPRAAGEISTVLKVYAGRDGEARSSLRYEPISSDIFSQYANLPGEAAKEHAVRLAAVALEIAWKQAGLSAGIYSSDRKGLVLGCALAGVSGMIDFANDVRKQTPRFVSPIRFPQTVGNYICGALARGYDFRGPASTIACGSASSLESIREGCALLSSGQADMVVAGGTELLSPEIVDGINQPDVRFADGACLFVLEREDAAQKRGAKILASVPGFGSRAGDQSTPRTQVVSTVGHVEPGAVCIEKWTGRTLGADGAAALAAAIGSTRGNVVPFAGEIATDEAVKTNIAALGREPTPRHFIIRALDVTNEIHELIITVG